MNPKLGYLLSVIWQVGKYISLYSAYNVSLEKITVPTKPMKPDKMIDGHLRVICFHPCAC